MKSVNLSDILSSSNPPQENLQLKECEKCKTLKPFFEFYKTSNKRKKRQLNNLLVSSSQYRPEFLQYKILMIQTDDYCKECRKNQVKRSQDSKHTKNIAEMINNFWDFHYNKYPEIANHFPGFGDFDNNPHKNTVYNTNNKPYILNQYTYMFFFQFHNDKYRKQYITTFLNKYIADESLHDQIEVSPLFQHTYFLLHKQHIPLFTIFKFCCKCKQYKQTYEEYYNLSKLTHLPRHRMPYIVTAMNFKMAALKSKNGWQRACLECQGDLVSRAPIAITKHITAPEHQQQLDPIRDRNTLYAQMPEEIFNTNPGEKES